MCQRVTGITLFYLTEFLDPGRKSKEIKKNTINIKDTGMACHKLCKQGTKMHNTKINTAIV